jgi:alkylhydroperoxidase family enzyme
MTFLNEPASSDGQQKMYDADIAEDGYVWDATKLWAHQASLNEQFEDLLKAVGEASGTTFRERAVLVIGQASTIGDSYCSLAWGRWLSEGEDPETAAAILRRDDGPLTDRERALGAWARRIASDPNGTEAADVQVLRDVGFEDAEIVALTFYAALRMALSTTNDALGARPDLALAEMLATPVRDAVTWGRQPA